MSATLRFLPRSLFAQRAEFVDTNEIPIQLYSQSKRFKALATIFGPVALAGILSALLVYGQNWKADEKFIDNLRRKCKQAAVAAGIGAFAGLNGVYVALEINRSWMLSPTARFGEDIRMSCRWSRGYTFHDTKGSKWNLLPYEDSWYLEDEDGGISTFPKPSKWEKGAAPVTIIDSQVSVVKKQGEITVDKRVQTGDPMAEDKYIIEGGEDRDVVAFALYLARMDGTISELLMWTIFAGVLGGGVVILKKVLRTKQNKFVQQPPVVDY
jgi:hypothetical protein